MEKTSKHVNYIRKSKAFNARLEEQAKSNLSGAERAFAGEIHMMGRKAYFDEYFYGIPLDNQELKQIQGIEDVRETKSFKEGYARGAFLASVGNVPEEYKNIDNNNKHR